jgi:hypothetical protein
LIIGGRNVPTFAVNMKHAAESCPLFNAEVKKRLKEMLGKREEVRDRANKHGVHVAFFLAYSNRVFLRHQTSAKQRPFAKPV